jgi:hypothetical protein
MVVDDISVARLGVAVDDMIRNLDDLVKQEDDASSALALLIRKMEYASQDIALIQRWEYYIKLLYWLAFFTWCACIVYERRFTTKTGWTFVLFTLFILLQGRIMDAVSRVIPADVTVKW